MSAEQLAQNGASPHPSSSPAVLPQSPPLPGKDGMEPCAATASYFLFSQGSVILSLHHDTLALDRKFENHEAEVIFISVDNVSEKGTGRLVISYDSNQTGIVWDLFTGTEISRFASFENIRVASWMRNGNVAFGNSRGEVVLFEPSTSEHISTRTIFDPITALAPAADCQTYAIGYLNGSILIASLQPSFTILHTLSTSRGPSPIVSLAWHTSSTKQKSDMLATQSVDGDLFLWSVSKHLSDAPRVIRSLRRSEGRSGDARWLAWSKNGRIIQYCDGETWAWDVKTKHVTYDPIPTIQGVKGLANYGPTATLFTLGPDNSVQQYDVGSAIMTANVQHPPGNSAPVEPAQPPSEKPTPDKLPDKSKSHNLTSQNLSHHVLGEGKRGPTSPSPNSTPTDVAHKDRLDQVVSPRSARSRTNSVSSGGSSHARAQYYSRAAKTLYSRTTTSFSTGSPVQSFADTSLYSGSSFRYGSNASAAGARGQFGGSRLRNELLSTTEEDDDIVTDLFPYLRTRLNGLPYSPPRQIDEGNLSSDQLRKYMLEVVFGWEGDIEDLIRDELGRHPVGSPRAIILARWLGHLDNDLMTSMSSSVTSSYIDWMLLALSGLGVQTETKTIARSFVQRLLSSGDIHASVAVLLGLGDGSDAIEVYVSRNLYLEAILLSCLLMPSEWLRLSYLVRKWGEHVVQNSQQNLAIRCFACTAADPPEPWSSPSMQMTNILSDQLKSQSPLAQSEPQPPSNTLGSTGPKNSSLKLITSFSPQPPHQFPFPGLNSADRTPTNAAGVTPIDSAHPDSALSPGGHKLNSSRGTNQPLSARALTPSAFAKHRLPSIGETPTDVMSPTFPAPKSLPTPGDSGSEKEKAATKSATAGDGSEQQQQEQAQRESNRISDAQLELLTSARYTPIETSQNQKSRETPQTAFPASGGDFVVPHEEAMATSTRKPQDLGIQFSEAPAEVPPGEEQLSATVFSNPWEPKRRGQQQQQQPWPTSSKEQDSARNSAASPGKSSMKSPTGASVSGRSIDDYISSLDEATYHSRKQKQDSSSKRVQTRGRSEQRQVEPAKRSPSSPIPMSPEDLALYSSSTADNANQRPKQHRSRNRSKPKSTASASRKTSKARGEHRNKSSSRPGSPDREGKSGREGKRGRSRHKESSEAFGVKSPSSPVPMSPESSGNYDRAPETDERLRLVNVERKQRLRSADRGSARHKERSTSRRRDMTPDRTKDREPPKPRQPQEEREAVKTPSETPYLSPGRIARHRYSKSTGGEPTGLQTPNGYPFGNSQFNQSASSLGRKEQAAAELEARRLSLARRPSAPAIPLPGDFKIQPSPSPRNHSENASPQSTGSFSQRASGKKSSPSYSTHSDQTSSSTRLPCNVPVGLPSTPRAMKHPKYSIGYAEQDIPAVPAIPDTNNLESPANGNGPPDFRRTMSAPPPEDVEDESTNVGGVPAHPHFNRQLRSSKAPNVTLPQRRQTAGNHPNQPSVSVEGGGKSGERPNPPLLPELQHLHPPLPPPPPMAPNGERHSLPGEERNSINSGSGVGTINIAIDNMSVEGANGNGQNGAGNSPQRPATTNSMNLSAGSPPMATTATAATNGYPRSSTSHDQHRRGRSINENLSSRLRNLTGRMRSTSRSRNSTISPPLEAGDVELPYESVKMGAK